MVVYSHSRISSFENCRLQYRYRYIDRIKRDVEGIEAFMGKLVHEVLEGLYKDLPAARAMQTGDLGDRFDALWEERFTPAVRIVRDEKSPESYRETGRHCVESYHRRYHPFDSGDVIGCEMQVEFSLDRQGLYRMQGYIDRIDRVGSDVLEIHDYKTGVLPREGALKKDRQLSLYEIALRQRHTGLREVRQVWHYLAHERTFVETRTLDDLRRTGVDTIHAIQTIEATADFPPRRSALCSWCDYKDICPEWEAERAALPAAVPAPGSGVPMVIEEPAPIACEADAGVVAAPDPAEPPAPPSAVALDTATGQYRLFG